MLCAKTNFTVIAILVEPYRMCKRRQNFNNNGQSHETRCSAANKTATHARSAPDARLSIASLCFQHHILTSYWAWLGVLHATSL